MKIKTHKSLIFSGAEAYIEAAKKVGLSARQAQLSQHAWKRHGGDIERPIQPHNHIWEAWTVAQKHANRFDKRLEKIKSELNVDGCTRPQQIKSIGRIFEKMLPKSGDVIGPIPLDLLGGKLVFDNLDTLYKSLIIVHLRFKVR